MKRASPRVPSARDGVPGHEEGQSCGATQVQLAAWLESCDARGILCSATKADLSLAYSNVHMSKLLPL